MMSKCPIIYHHKWDGRIEWMIHIFNAANIPELRTEHNGKFVLCISATDGSNIPYHYEIGNTTGALLEIGKAKLIEFVKGFNNDRLAASHK